MRSVTIGRVWRVAPVRDHRGRGRRSVADAAMKRDKDAVRALLKDGADVNAAQGDGMTALHWAALNGDVELAADAAVRRRQREGDDAAWRLHAADAGRRAGPRRR